MIIGSALGRLFNGLSIELDSTTVSVQYDYGHQDALDTFIAEMDKIKAKKFPLVFYVVGKTSEFNGWKTCRTQLIIMTNTQSEWLSKKRTNETYDRIIEPIYQKLKYTLRNGYVQILDDNSEKLSYMDLPNFGIVKGGVPSKSSKESVVTDYVDARKIDLNIRIKTNCI